MISEIRIKRQTQQAHTAVAASCICCGHARNPCNAPRLLAVARFLLNDIIRLPAYIKIPCWLVLKIFEMPIIMNIDSLIWHDKPKLTAFHYPESSVAPCEQRTNRRLSLLGLTMVGC
jgi:hypothetical protein